MPRTAPLAPWMALRNLVLAAVLPILFCSASCVRYHKDAADLQNGSDAPASTAFHPTSPFLHFDGADACIPSGQTDGIKNPFDLSHVSGSKKRLMEVLAESQIGTLYRSGGISPATGFDCSGFTCWVYGKLGVNLPRSSREQFQEGKDIRKSELRRGDLVFFGNDRHITHVGIYLEDHKFIHSSSTGDTVKISSLDEPVWERKYAGARRFF